jgi:hypothetical protein
MLGIPLLYLARDMTSSHYDWITTDAYCLQGSKPERFLRKEGAAKATRK